MNPTYCVLYFPNANNTGRLMRIQGPKVNRKVFTVYFFAFWIKILERRDLDFHDFLPRSSWAHEPIIKN